MISITCKKCNYKFHKKEIPPRCPYCSRKETLEETKSAQNWLDEVTSEMKD